MNFSFIDFCKDATDNGMSGNGTTDKVWELGEYRTNGIVLAVFQTIFLLIGLPWNLMVIVTIIKEKLYKEPTIVLLLNLVIIDLLMLVVIIPLNIVIGAAGEYILGDSDAARCGSCRIGFLNTFFPVMSVYTVAMMALDRFIYLYKPLRYEKWITIPRILIVLLVTWVVITIIAALPLMVDFGDIVFIRQVSSCIVRFAERKKFYFRMVIVLSCPPVILSILCNIGVIYIVQKNIREVYATNKTMKDMNGEDKKFNKKIKRKRLKKQFHLVRVFGALLLSNILSWLPIVIIAFISLFTPFEKIPTFIVVTSFLLFNSQITIHPILESKFISSVRKPLKKMILGCCCLKECISRSEQNGMGNSRCACCINKRNDDSYQMTSSDKLSQIPHLRSTTVSDVMTLDNNSS